MGGKIIKHNEYESDSVNTFVDISRENELPGQNRGRGAGTSMKEAGKQVRELFESVDRTDDSPGGSTPIDEIIEDVDLNNGAGRVTRNMFSAVVRERDELKNELAAREQQVSRLENKIKQLRKKKRSEGYDVGYADGVKQGISDGAEKVTTALDTLHSAIADELEQIRTESQGRWETIRELVIVAVRKIIGTSFAPEHAQEIIENITAVFPDENRIVLRVSPDLFEVFKSTKHENFKIVKDKTQHTLSLLAEAEDGVADFSIDTQIENLREWLTENDNA